MPTPFNIQGTLNLPGAPSLPTDPIPFGVALAYDAKASYEYNFQGGSGSKTVDFGTTPTGGYKGVLVMYEGTPPAPSVDPPPVAVTINSSSAPIEISSGGFLCVGSPKPLSGITAMYIAYTGLGKVRVWLIG